METLHLSYPEVVHEIPYCNLVIMQKDKLHETSKETDNVEYKGARDNLKFKELIK